jgi:AcrR family transcriptional regulator
MSTANKFHRREVSTPKGVVLTRPGPVGGVRDNNRLVKQQKIRDAALILFLQHGVEGVSVDDIMQSADMAKGSFYRYFADQTALVEDLMAPARSAMVESLESCSRELDSASTRDAQVAAYKRIGNVLAILLMEFPGQVRLYLQESRAPAVGARRPVVSMAKTMSEYAIELTRKAQKHGILKPIPVAISALSVVGATERLLLAVLHEEDIGDVLQVPEAVATLILDGLKA